MTGSSPSAPEPEPLAALPLLAEAGVSVYWVPLDGRTAWVADVDSRQVWISRSVPREGLLHCLVEALSVIDEGGTPADPPGPGLRLVHDSDGVEETPAARPALRVLREG
ncbi:hypothetical protein [Actinomycetospora flava]|uniref:Uncharacterized protein n=1 Tax=Actinomycetospora flava TaxID=3129232 RepID=A0ABU8M3Q5_9PSEU